MATSLRAKLAMFNL